MGHPELIGTVSGVLAAVMVGVVFFRSRKPAQPKQSDKPSLEEVLRRLEE